MAAGDAGGPKTCGWLIQRARVGSRHVASPQKPSNAAKRPCRPCRVLFKFAVRSRSRDDGAMANLSSTPCRRALANLSIPP